MFKQKDKEIHLIFGQKIPWETFDKTKSSAGMGRMGEIKII